MLSSFPDLTPLQYAERYVFPSEERLVLYNHIFNLHMEEFDEDEDEKVERSLLGKVSRRFLTDFYKTCARTQKITPGISLAFPERGTVPERRDGETDDRGRSGRFPEPDRMDGRNDDRLQDFRGDRRNLRAPTGPEILLEHADA